MKLVRMNTQPKATTFFLNDQKVALGRGFMWNNNLVETFQIDLTGALEQGREPPVGYEMRGAKLVKIPSNQTSYHECKQDYQWLAVHGLKLLGYSRWKQIFLLRLKKVEEGPTCVSA